MSPPAIEPLDPALYREVVRRAIAEDLGWGDVTTEATVPAGLRAVGRIVSKSACVVAGLAVATEAFRQLDPGVAVTIHRGDGERAAVGDAVADVRGDAAAMLTAERTALNFLQRLSGIATLTRAFVDAAAGGIAILDTRKTTPTLRALEKYAVRCGGGQNHRSTLDGGILIKDNHVQLAGGIDAAMHRMQSARTALPIEIEVQSLDELDRALAAGVPRILVDNMSLDEIGEAVRRSQGRADIEISGGVTLERLPALARTGARYVSVGALTHSAPAADLSFGVASEPEA